MLKERLFSTKLTAIIISMNDIGTFCSNHYWGFHELQKCDPNIIGSRNARFLKDSNIEEESTTHWIYVVLPN